MFDREDDPFMKKYRKLLPFILFSTWFTYLTLFVPLQKPIFVVSFIIVSSTIIYGVFYYFWIYSTELIRGKVRIRRKSLKDLEVLNRLLELIHEERDFKEVLQSIMKEAFRVIPGAESSSMFIYNSKRGVYEFQSACSVIYEYFKDVCLTIEEVEAKFRNRKGPFIDNLVSQSNSCYREEIKKKFKSYGVPAAILYIPIWIEGQLKGYITLDNWKDSKAFNHWDIVKIEQILPQLKLAFYRAQRTAQLADYKYKLKQLYHIGQELATIDNSEELISKVITSIYKILKYENVNIFLLQDNKLIFKNGYISIKSSHESNYIEFPDITLDEGICGWVVLHGEPLIVSNVKEDPRYIKMCEKINSQMAVPIKLGNKIFGVLNLESYRLDGFTYEDQELMMTITSQLGIVLSNAKYQNDLKKALLQIIMALAKSIETKDNVTGGHCERMERYSLEIGKYLKFNSRRLEKLRRAAILHDVGKVGIPVSILEKPEKLTEEEFKIMQEHPTYGANILREVDFLREVANIVEQHHERVDGQGYPFGLQGDDIFLEARIIAVVDAYDAMTSDRPYRHGFSSEKAMEELLKYQGKQFDPQIVDIFIKLFIKNENKNLEGKL